MKILVASDSFKGTLTSREVGRIVQEELAPAHQVDCLPVSDGGEGLVDALQGLFPGHLREICGMDPLGRKIPCRYIFTADKTAIIESAEAAGLGLLAESERNPMNSSSYGLGLLIDDALRQGAERVYIGLGGSAVNDGGTGLLRAIGVRLLDKKGEEIREDGGKILSRINALDTSALDPVIQRASFFALCDVDNPLLGPRGATCVYGPQKRASPEMLAELEKGMASFARLVMKDTGHDFTTEPGAGAAGGLGFCLISYFNAKLLKGFEAFGELTGLEEKISGHDLIITGEGKLDGQTESGKVPVGMLRLGVKHHIPVLCICGLDESGRDMGFKKIYSIVPVHASIAESLASPGSSLRKLIRNEVKPWIDKSFPNPYG